MLSSYLIMVGGEQSSWMMGLPLLGSGEGCSWAQQVGRLERREALLDPGDVVGLARVGLWIVAVVIADNALRYTYVIAFNVPLLEQLLALVGFKHLVGSVHPTGGEPERVRRIEHIRHHYAAVVQVSGHRFIRQNDNHGGCSVVRIVRPSAEVHIEPRQPIAYFAVGNNDDLGGLFAHAAGRIATGFGY